MLIHGIWSGPQTWVYFGVRANNQLTPLVNDQRFKAYLIDYEDTKGDGFAVNADLVKQEIVQRLDPFTKGSNRQGILVAAVQVDIVAHSMGGDLARTMVTRPNYLSANNYQKGLIHKLITIDTPHLGSEFANRLYNSKQLCKFAWGRSGKKVGDAVRDLQTTSVMITKTLRQKIFPLEASTINGIATPDQAASTQENFQNLKWGLAQAVCPSLLPAGGFAAIFGQDTSDLIVSGKSQEAVGIGYDGGDPPTATSIGLIHTVDSSLFTNGPDALSRNIQNGAVVGVDTVNPQGVIDLLNTPVGTTGFGALLP
jgi:pimeloyl-ACP methyl ester carboxylesterase